MNEVQAEPAVMWRGHVSLYEAPDGGIVLAYQADGSEETGHHHVPGMLVKTALAMQGTSPLDFVKGMMRRGG